MQGLRRLRVPPAALARLVSQAFCSMIFDWGDVHCDPHPANMLVRAAPQGAGCSWQLVLLDHGLYRSLPDDFRLQYGERGQGEEGRGDKEAPANCLPATEVPRCTYGSPLRCVLFGELPELAALAGRAALHARPRRWRQGRWAASLTHARTRPLLPAPQPRCGVL